jgi:DNA-binding transcriptional ArsR family regulator
LLLSNPTFIVKAAKALSDPHRLRIWKAVVQQGSLTIGEVQQLTILSQPSVSFHVKQLTECELLLATKKGRTVHLMANPDSMEEFLAFFAQLE